MTTEAINAYMAGILDGEGHFSMYFHERFNRHHVTVGVMNTSRDLIDWLVNNFGGYVYEHKPKSHKPHWKPCWEWRMKVQEIPGRLPPILPYLVIKRRQAELAISFRETINPSANNPRKKGVSPEILALRHKIMDELKSLNRKGITA